MTFSPADAALIAVVTASFVLEAIIGFGGTVFVVTLGAQLLPLDKLLPAFIPVGVLLSLAILWRDRRHVHGGLLLRRVLPFMGIGMAAGLAVPAAVGQAPLLVAFGVLTMALALPEALAVAGLRPGAAGADAGRPPLPRALSGGILALGGLVHGLFGAGGPMVVYFLGREHLDRRVFRATLAALWVCLNTVLLASYGIKGYFNAECGMRAALLLPGLLVGGALGQALHDRVDARLFRGAVFALLFLAGLSLAVRNLWAMGAS